MADKPDYQNYEENPWQIDSARYKFAPWLIVHCRRTETYYDPSDEGIGSLTGTNTVS